MLALSRNEEWCFAAIPGTEEKRKPQASRLIASVKPRLPNSSWGIGEPTIKEGHEILGSNYGGWGVDQSMLSEGMNGGKGPLVYSIGAGEDLSFDEAMINKYGARVYSFDPTPKSMRYVKKRTAVWPPGYFTSVPEGLGVKEETLTFTLPENDKFVSLAPGAKNSNENRLLHLKVNSLSNFMNRFGHTHVDVLKMDIESAEFAVLEDWIARRDFPMTQLCIEFHQRLEEKTYVPRMDAITSALQNEFGFKKLLALSRNKEWCFARTTSVA